MTRDLRNQGRIVRREWCAIAYSNGYKAGLDDCEKADVGKLIEKVAALEGRLAFEKARRKIAERQLHHASDAMK